MSKIVKSTRSLEEHIDNVLQIRELKNKGESDRSICKSLEISHTTLQRYKGILAETDLKSITAEGQNAKRCELDDQVQSVVCKLSEVVNKIEVNHENQKNEIQRILSDPEVENNLKIKLRQINRYPVEEMLEVQKAILNAVDLRVKIWGLDKEIKDSLSIQDNKKLILNVHSDGNIHQASNKLHKIADAIVGKTDGM